MAHRHLLIFALLPCWAAAAPVNEAACPDTTAVPSCTGPTSVEEYWVQLASQGHYDKSKRPACGNSTFAGPTVVEVQLYLTQVNEVDQKLGQVTVNGYMRSWWHDPRLAFRSEAEGGCLDAVRMAGADAEGIWEPDLYFDNLVSLHTHESRLLEIYPDGGVWKSEQITLTVKSPISLGKLPYDMHTARIVVASYSQDISLMRVIPRGGAVGRSSSGGGRSGVGIIAAPLSSSVWAFGAEEGHHAHRGFETPALVEIKFSWDYVTLEFHYSRMPKYYVDQVILPSLLFLTVSYIQFWVDPAAAPARAALAVIPVLIQRTLSNQVYKSLPEGSQRMWLSDYVATTIFISVLAACQFGVVQFCQLQEKRRAAKLAGLQKAGEVARKLFNVCEQDGTTLLDLLSECSAQQVSVDSDLPVAADVRVSVGEPFTEMQPNMSATSSTSMPCKIKSERAVRYGMSEADLMFIKYAQIVFERFDQDRSGHCHPSEVRRSLKYFNIFLSTFATASMMGMFLRDEGLRTSVDEMQLTLTFDQFTKLLSKVGDYTVHAKACSKGSMSIVAKMQGLAPSKRCDSLARWLFPAIVIVTVAGFYLLLPLY
eukprot:CAMPEP_0115413560 /NCGR_PEP_ID=MMETSP0271-20121206/22133_1 /TAXON_ID=71861 /ORGANISM="Scrippsiella trochoidea, Strain CCMP3099" /LENGTH=594 /DNA_ID=CAMNT_0002837843 /DNA_START=46 /DNA_END=1830 /DNA_ORIENTATION=-